MDRNPKCGISKKPVANVPITLPRVENIPTHPAENPTRSSEFNRLTNLIANGVTEANILPAKAKSAALATTGPSTIPSASLFSRTTCKTGMTMTPIAAARRRTVSVTNRGFAVHKPAAAVVADADRNQHDANESGPGIGLFPNSWRQDSVGRQLDDHYRRARADVAITRRMILLERRKGLESGVACDTPLGDWRLTCAVRLFLNMRIRNPFPSSFPAKRRWRSAAHRVVMRSSFPTSFLIGRFYSGLLVTRYGSVSDWIVHVQVK